jgi:hypothetical protein
MALPLLAPKLHLTSDVYHSAAVHESESGPSLQGTEVRSWGEADIQAHLGQANIAAVTIAPRVREQNAGAQLVGGREQE